MVLNGVRWGVVFGAGLLFSQPGLSPTLSQAEGIGKWSHNDDDGDVAGVGLGLNLPLGPLMATVGGKGVYTNPNYGDEGYAAAGC